MNWSTKPSTRRWLKATPLLWLALAAPAAAAPVVTEFSAGITPNAELGDIVLGPDGKLWFTEKTVEQDRAGHAREPAGDRRIRASRRLHRRRSTSRSATTTRSGSPAATAPGRCAGSTRPTPPDKQGHGGYDRSASPGRDRRGPRWEDLARRSGRHGDPEQIPHDMHGRDWSPRTSTSPASTSATSRPVPDGNVWVTDFGGQIGARHVRRAVVTPFDVRRRRRLGHHRSGPDGNLWYTAPEGDDTKIGRDHAGRRRSGLQFERDAAWAISAASRSGPDGALWFAQAFANSIGRMTLDGNFTVIGGLTAGARPEYIARGPDNTLWFTEKDGNRIGRITGIDLPQQQPPPPPPPGHHRPDVRNFRVTRQGLPAGRARHRDPVHAHRGRHGHDQVRPPRARPLAAGAADDDVPVHRRRSEASVQAAASTASTR